MSDELKPCPFCGNNPTLRECNGGWIIECEHHGWNENGEALRNETIAGDVDMCSWGSTESARAALIDAWNARAAVIDGQFSLAVHDGETWQKVRTCQMSMCDEDDDDLPAYYRSYKCDACGKTHARYKGDDYDYCPRCGAKVTDEEEVD